MTVMMVANVSCFITQAKHTVFTVLLHMQVYLRELFCRWWTQNLFTRTYGCMHVASYTCTPKLMTLVNLLLGQQQSTDEVDGKGEIIS